MTNYYHIPGNTHIIDELYVIFSVDKNGEGICATMTANGTMPLITSNKKLLSEMIKIAKEMAKESGVNMKVYKFKKSEIIEEICGNH